MTIDISQLDQLIIERLPILMQQNTDVQELVIKLAQQRFADRQETNDRFYQLLEELKRDREERRQQWEKYSAEQNQKWEEQNKKWWANQKAFEKVHEARP